MHDLLSKANSYGTRTDGQTDGRTDKLRILADVFHNSNPLKIYSKTNFHFGSDPTLSTKC